MDDFGIVRYLSFLVGSLCGGLVEEGACGSRIVPVCADGCPFWGRFQGEEGFVSGMVLSGVGDGYRGWYRHTRSWAAAEDLVVRVRRENGPFPAMAARLSFLVCDLCVDIARQRKKEVGIGNGLSLGHKVDGIWPRL